MVDQDPRAPPPKQEEGAAAHATYKGQVLALTLTPTLTLTLTPYP